MVRLVESDLQTTKERSYKSLSERRSCTTESQRTGDSVHDARNGTDGVQTRR